MEKKDLQQLHFDTQLVHAGSQADELTRAVAPPIYQTSTFKHFSPGKHKGFDYGRTHNPTRARLEEAYARVENAEYAVASCSGMGAELVILHSMPHQSRILASDHEYGGTYRILTTIFKEIHNTNFIDFRDLDTVENYLKKNKCDYFWIESPTNPLFRIVDIKAICALAKKYGAKTIIDNTIATPYAQRPINMGVDVVFHSSTKYLNGHSDVIAGAIMTSDKEWYDKLYFVQNSVGATPAPFDCWLILRGIKTLALRMKEHEKNALQLARWLSGHPKIEKVIYPGLPSHPDHELAKRQMSNFGGMLSFYLRDADKEQTGAFLSRLELYTLAVSLGGVETLIDQPFVMTHGSMPEQVKLSLGIKPNTVRVSVGIENIEDLIRDMERALEKV